MECPFCKVPTTDRAPEEGPEIDRCPLCGALWFDFGEIRELVEGRLEQDGEGGAAPDKEKREWLRSLHKQAAGIRCPRCGGALRAIDFRMTGIPVLTCRECRGILAPRRSAAAIEARSRFAREHREGFQALGETMAGEVRRRMERAHGTTGDPPAFPVPVPVVVPLADESPPARSRPFATWGLIVLLVAIHVAGQVAGRPPLLPGGLPGLPSGAGLRALSLPALLFAPFLHGGIVPLAAGILFLFVLGDNVEDRMGRYAFVLLYVGAGAVSGAAHVLWGGTGQPPALGSAGAVAAILGAYLVFFPQVEIRMYRFGEVGDVPAYLFACAWVAATLAIGPGPLARYLNPSPLSLAGTFAGLAAGIVVGAYWRLREEAQAPGAVRT